MLGQIVVYFALNLYTDHKLMNGFKECDKEESTIERVQLPQGNDVLNHMQETWKGYEAKDDYLIKAKGINKVYSGFAAVKDNSFQVKKGQTLGLLGPNGAGKSTTFNLITMDLQRSQGDIKLFNDSIDGIDTVKRGQKMGMVPQYNTIWDVLTVDECIDFIG